MQENLFSYLYGIFITDGSMYLSSRNRGRISLEISLRDRQLVEDIYKLVPNSSIRYRRRNTNFKSDYESIIFINHNRECRQYFIERGFPLKDKSDNADIPKGSFIERDFWRGVIDGNGSVGFFADKTPFISLVMKGDILKDAYLKFLSQFGIVKFPTRNARDNIYNISISAENAVNVANFLYSKNDIIHLDRKFQKAIEFARWVRTKKRCFKKNFSEEEVKYILTHTVEECMLTLKRSRKSIQIKKFRLNQAK